MKIPKSIRIGVMTYEVKVSDAIPGPQNAHNLAFVETDQGRIWLAKGKQTEEVLALSFLHECVHAMLAEIAETKLSENERFVELFSRQLYTFIEKNRGAL
jgi:hypothetical protein